LNEKSRELNLEVIECSEHVAEVTALRGSGFRFVVNLHEKTCSCRQWQVSGISCKHAIAFITSVSNVPLENYVDIYYSAEKFRVAYAQLVPAMEDKSQWPQSCHGFFMHPPLLKATAGRRKTEVQRLHREDKEKRTAQMSYLYRLWPSLAKLQEGQSRRHCSNAGCEVINYVLFEVQ